jgi:hypothetical protein
MATIKQDRNGARTPQDVERKHKFRLIEQTSKDVEELKEDIVVDTALSSTSTHSVENRVITKALAGKVNSIDGRGLSENNYTDDEKSKLSGIEEGAEKNILEKIFVAGEEQTITNKGVNLYVDSYMSAYSENPVQNKVVKAYIDEIANSESDVSSAIYQEYHTDYSGYVWFNDGFLVQWGRTSVTPTAINTDTTARITFTYSYDNIPDRKTEVSSATPTVAKVTSGGGTTTTLSKQGMNIYVNSSTTRAVTVDWMATGFKSV